jgi:hypothetical protein
MDTHLAVYCLYSSSYNFISEQLIIEGMSRAKYMHAHICLYLSAAKLQK